MTDNWCDCPLATEHGEDHLVADHKYDCGGWTTDPPCGGCLKCIAMQLAYYSEKKDDVPNS